MDSQQPPIPPAVAAQQAPPLRQFAQQGGVAGAQQAVQQAPSMQLVEQTMNEVTKGLEKVAQIVVQERPELVPLLKPVVQGLAMFMSKIKSGQGGAPEGGSQGTAGQGSPDAPGATAVGMPPQ